jgi:molybdenum cofactor biosynthesis enzyme MoaA
MEDKLIHKDEFRLRVLLTNQCNKNCSFCLNDFQEKGEQFAAMPDVIDCMRAYGQFMRSIKEPSIVTFSGGEPGLYPFLNMVVTYAIRYCDTVKVVTNGSALYQVVVPKDSIKWHVGVTDKNQNVIEYFRNISQNLSVQIVVTDNMTLETLFDLIDFYHREGIVVKLFVDFFSENKELLKNHIVLAINKFENGICTRFTGNQINRGVACSGCERECVTLKALWYFPNGLSSTCPQGMVEYYDDDSWDETVEKAYYAHKYAEAVKYG